MTYGSK